MFFGHTLTLLLLMFNLLSAHGTGYAMIGNGGWRAPAEEIWVSDTLDGVPELRSVPKFSEDKKHEEKFMWYEGILDCDVKPELKIDPNSEEDNWGATVLEQVFKNQNKLVLRYINEQLGWGVFAREDIVPVPGLGPIYLSFHAGDYIQGGAERILPGRKKYIFQIDKGEKICIIDALRFRNMGGFIQHAPTDLQDYVFSSEFDRSTVATSNLKIMIAQFKGAPFIVFFRQEVLPKDSQLLYDYGNAFWQATEECPLLFSKRGEVLDSSLYWTNKVFIKAIFDKEASLLLDPYTYCRLELPVNVDSWRGCGQKHFPLPINSDSDSEFFIYPADIVAAHEKNPQNLNLFVTAHVMPRRCNTCGLQPEKLQVCGKCKKKYYCNIDCQRKDWKKHKQNCTSPVPK